MYDSEDEPSPTAAVPSFRTDPWLKPTVFRLLSADYLRLVWSKEAAGRRRWTDCKSTMSNRRPTSKQQHTDLTHSSLALARITQLESIFFTWLASSSLNAFRMRKWRPLKAEVKPATEMRWCIKLIPHFGLWLTCPLFWGVVKSRRRQRAVSCARPWTMHLWVVIGLYEVKMIHNFLKMNDL